MFNIKNDVDLKFYIHRNEMAISLFDAVVYLLFQPKDWSFLLWLDTVQTYLKYH